MLRDILNKEVIKINIKCLDWRDAIRKGSEILVEKRFVEERYIDAIFKSFEEFGSYMVIAPGVVLSHARPENGVKKLSMSLITLKDPIEFGNEMNDPVKIVITLAAIDSEAHMNVIRKLMELIMNDEDLNKLMNLTEIEEAMKIINKY